LAMLAKRMQRHDMKAAASWRRTGSFLLVAT